MSTSLLIRFPLGRYHGTPWDRHVNEGAVDWPPSPWRVLRALYATWRSRLPGLDPEVAQALLEDLATLPSFLVPPWRTAHTRHYVPDGYRSPSGQQGEEGTDLLLDAFVAVDPSLPLVITWPVDLGDAGTEALAALVERLPYLGRTESVCSARLGEEGEASRHHVRCEPLSATVDLERDRPATRLLAARLPLDAAALDARPAALRRSGQPRPPGTYWGRYATFPEPAASRTTARLVRARPLPDPVTAVRWIIDESSRPALTSAVAVGDRLRKSVMAQFGKVVQESDGVEADTLSSLLSGRTPDGARVADDHEHAHFLALPADLGASPDAQRLVHSLVLWGPGGGAGLDTRELLAASRVREVRPSQRLRELRAARIAMTAYGRVEDAAPGLCGPSATWRTLTPLAPARHIHRRQDWPTFIRSEVAQELRYRDLPEPIEVELMRGPWLSWRRHRQGSLRDAPPAVGLRLTFDAPVPGPIVLGALSHFGLGVFVPEGNVSCAR
jgi:CRISPR-associated protein Csb2